MEIILKNLDKLYESEDSVSVHAVNNVSLSIPSNEIFGIIGKSGAGKSTLVRLISLLEKPDSGEVWYDDERVDNLSGASLIQRRRKIGMIFQNFNLLSSRNAEQNIAYPLEICGTPKAVIKQRTKELLELVGLSDRAKSPVSQLSGGQKQRIAIARALANNPDILFCTMIFIARMIEYINMTGSCIFNFQIHTFIIHINIHIGVIPFFNVNRIS